MKALLRSTNISEATKKISVTGSKSESNRLLLLQALFPDIKIQNLSESDDTVVLKQGLSIDEGMVDVHHAGTAMRFLTAYFAAKKGAEIVLTGSERMQQRPVKILVDALRELGANIEYMNEEGFPPLRIKGKNLKGSSVSIKANVSSQYISALSLIAPSLKNGLTIDLKGEVTSTPYINMTISLLKQLGVEANFSENKIVIKPGRKKTNTVFVVESDWSSASYFYSFIALSKKASVTLTSYSEKSLQGDAALVDIYEMLGVETVFKSSTSSEGIEEKSITLRSFETQLPDYLSLDLSATPDIAQTIAVSCFGLGIGCKLTGLHTLKIKETDRLEALETELRKFGAEVSIDEESIELHPGDKSITSKNKDKNIHINTYQDHRMAMAFAPLALLFPIAIKDPMVVTKSFPSFYQDLEKMGLTVEFV
ncbi:3-phosphoshikimate 1-carboxyvinyltransferase [Ulvibacter antarcticus]|uniref:3-phosphoshikimate 1-carboxyvinyltransferase n=1 Tax=Ulvibacter antarcticus TaxID=442714 RepID=A0A3L9Y913_9FLAO|nr:3-phosphoshikimate 1-carboxyvinyltransferase [Ulvibacter antarcticus]RMA57196.1 3-phosphoshikimate 1-carboxyvinyltransferase [Ulvibacter antarcticus]